MTDKPIRDAWKHGKALLNSLRGKPEYRHARGIEEALREIENSKR